MFWLNCGVNVDVGKEVGLQTGAVYRLVVFCLLSFTFEVTWTGILFLHEIPRGLSGLESGSGE